MYINQIQSEGAVDTMSDRLNNNNDNKQAHKQTSAQSCEHYNAYTAKPER